MAHSSIFQVLVYKCGSFSFDQSVKKIDESARMTSLLVNNKASLSFKFVLLLFALDKRLKPSSNENSITMKSSMSRGQRSTMVSILASRPNYPGYCSQHSGIFFR